MKLLTEMPGKACYRSANLLIAIVALLLLGKLITWVPVMEQLELFGVFRADDIVWLSCQAVALLMFFFFVRDLSGALPDRGGALSFLKAVAGPLATLVIVIFAQALLWQLLKHFADGAGRTFYFSFAVLAIVAATAWMVVSVYRNATYLVEASKKVAAFMSGLSFSRMEKCDECGSSMPSDAHYCGQCGHKRAEALCCERCGKEISPEQNYCQHCGAEIS